MAAAIAKERLKGKSLDGLSSITFEVVEVASSMGWNLYPVKRELRQLQWKQEPDKGENFSNYSSNYFHSYLAGFILHVSAKCSCNNVS